MPALSETFETGQIKTSTTQYRWMTDDEFLSLLEQRFGKSPILDELYLRMERNQDAIEWMKQSDDALETAETEHKEKVDALNEKLSAFSVNLTDGRCSVCDANLVLSIKL